MARGTNDYGRVEGGLRHVAELPSYVLANTGVLTMVTGLSLISLLNPAASGQLAKVRRITISVAVQENDVVGGVDLKLHRITAHGTGATITPRPFDTADAASVCTGRQNMTVEPGYGVQLGTWSATVMKDNDVGQKFAGTTAFEFRIFDYVSGGPGKPLTLREGQGLTLEVDTNSVQAETCAVIEFTEEPA